MTLLVGARAARSDIPSRDRLPSLTGLRFWAALLVVLYHLTLQVGPVQPVSALAFYGRSGVSFFFVLSGFVLAWTYLGSPTSVPVFLWRRFARLWPLVFVTGLVSLVVYALLGTHVAVTRAMSTFLFVQAWRGSWAAGANPASWSLSDEAFFYVLFPLVLAAAALSWGRRALWAAVALALPALFVWAWLGGWLTWQFDYYPPVRLAQFVLGVLCGVAVRRGLRFRVPFIPAVALVVAYHAVLYGLHLWSSASGGHGRSLLYSGSQWWSAPVYALLIVAAAQADLHRRPTGLGSAAFLRLGHWSYAWYLIHEVVIRLVVGWGGRPTSQLAVAGWWLGLLAITLTCAFVLYTVVEHPAERRLRALVRPRHPAADATASGPRSGDATAPGPRSGDGRREVQDLRRPSSP